MTFCTKTCFGDNKKFGSRIATRHIHKQCYIVELCAGNYGFLLPPDQIIPTAEETWAFHATVMRELLKGK